MAQSRTHQQDIVIDKYDETIQYLDGNLAIPCIQYDQNDDQNESIWRPNPRDPFIYISFSKHHLTKTYGADKLYQLHAHRNTSQAFDEDGIRKCKEIIKKEWIERAGVPIKFLSDNSSSEEVQSKNVIFVLEDSELVSLGTAQALLSDKEYERMMAGWEKFRASYKIVTLKPFCKAEVLSRHETYVLLHELAHAITESKHFKPHDPGDVPPYCNLDCTQSVMAYSEDCIPIGLAAEFLFNRTAFLFASDDDEQFKKFRDLIHRVVCEEVSPIELGYLDLAAAQQFKKNWEERNKAAQASEIQTLKAMIVPLYSCAIDTCIKAPFRYISNAVNDCFDYILDAAQNYATDVVNTCPSYFPPNDVTKTARQKQPAYSQYLMFQPTGNINMMSSLQIGYQATSYLGN